MTPTIETVEANEASATVIGGVIKVPVMLILVKICLTTTGWFGKETRSAAPAYDKVGGTVSQRPLK